MVTKFIAFYGNKTNYTNKSTNQLFVEISPTQVVFLLKSTIITQLEAIEIFQFDSTLKDWSGIFTEIKEQSDLIALSFSSTTIYLNTPDALLVPLNNLSDATSNDFLSLVYGSVENSMIKQDIIHQTLSFATLYSVNNFLNTTLTSHFKHFNIQHTYTAILRAVFERINLPKIFLKLIVYHQHVIVVYVKDQQLQLTQSYSFNSSEDILYYLLGIIQQDGLTAIQTQIEISGLIDQQIGLYDYIKKSFGIVTFDDNTLLNTSNIGLDTYPTYTFTPFYKLMV